MNLSSRRFTPGVQAREGLLILPAAGGGISLPELATTRERYLNLTLTVEEDHSLAFELRLWGQEESPRVTIRFGLMPRYRTHVPIDLNWLDGHILFPGHVAGELKVVCHGSRIARQEIRRAELVSVAAFHEVRVRLEDVELAETPRPAAPVPAEPLIDEMGQYIPRNWPGKTPSVEAMRAWLQEQAGLPGEYPFARWNQWGGCRDLPLQPGSGFFGKVKVDGRWHLVDPEGCAFFSMGPDCACISRDARVDGQEGLLRWMPDPEDPQWAGVLETRKAPFGEAARGPVKAMSFAGANLRRAFGGDWEEQWRQLLVGQLKRAGMNSLGNWSDSTLFGRMPYVTSLPRFPETRQRIFRDFPDVLSPEYEEDARRCAQALAARRDDPFMIGYFLRNEPNWAFVDNLVLADEVLRNPADTACKQALIRHLAERYGDVEALNRAWGTSFGDFAELNRPLEGASALSAQAEGDLRAFSARLVEAYTAVPARACRAVDPNHMILGMRWAWISDPALVAGWESFDVFSINRYAVDPTEAMDRVCQLGVDLPVIIGEFHFGALDAGLTATGLEGVPSQAERGKAYRYYVERVAAHPNGVGCHYFQCYDQFALGRFDGENYNIGLFDVCLRPYGEMLAASLACGQGIYGVRTGQIPPTGDKPASIPMIAF